MRRSAVVVLFLGFLLPAAGQSDRLQPGGFSEFAPRGRPRPAPDQRQYQGQPSSRGQRPPAYQPQGAGSPPVGYSPAGNMGQGRGPAGATPAPNSSKPLPTKGYLLDARHVRAKEGRVPNGFGQLGLSHDQRERIYGIRELYDHHIERLEALIERLESEEEVQCQHILTGPQRRMYQRYLMEKGE